MQGEMVPKHELFKNIPLHVQKVNYEEDIYELKDHVGEEALSLNLLPKLGLAKRTFLASFPNCLLESALVESTFPYALLPHHKGAKVRHIVVTRGTKAKLSHHKNHMLIYPMENEMPLVHHIIK